MFYDALGTDDTWVAVDFEGHVGRKVVREILRSGRIGPTVNTLRKFNLSD